jgi:S-adenosylmethionine-diacylglycerol 3-amino-3-carboxypropyl transferase
MAVDSSPTQIACLELRVAAFRLLSHSELLELLGAAPSDRRIALYARIRHLLSPLSRSIWDRRPDWITTGAGACGKFERYLHLYRALVLPLIHGPRTIDALSHPLSRDERALFYDRVWDNRRWRTLFRLFFSRAVMGRIGRDSRFFTYVDGRVADRLLDRTRHAVVDLDPLSNPYLQWITLGRYVTALPHALREENHETIRGHLDRLEWRLSSMEAVLDEVGPGTIDKINLSDILEYLSEPEADHLLAGAARAGRAGGRIAYWNLFVPRSRPKRLAPRLRPLPELSASLSQQAKTFFYSRFVLEEIT